MIDRLTCCPYCGTSFRITEDQLQTARGAVRCGSCLRIFKALEHLVEAVPTGEFNVDEMDFSAIDDHMQPQEDSEENAQPVEQGFSLSGDDDESLGLKEESLEELLLDQHLNLGQLDEELDDQLDELLDEQQNPLTNSSDDADANPDNPPENNAAEDTGEHKVIEDTQTLSLGDLNAAFQQRGQFGDHPGALFDRQLRVVESHAEHHTDESWALSLLEELESAEGRSQPHQAEQASPAGGVHDNAVVGQFYTDPERLDATNPCHSYINLTAIDAALSCAPPANDDDSDALAADEDDEPEQPAVAGSDQPGIHEQQQASADVIKRDTESAAAIANQNTEAAAEPGPFQLLRQIASAPVEIETRSASQLLRRKLRWAGLCLLASLCLVLQIAWLRFAEISQTRPWRQGLEIICPLLGCRLTPLRAPEQIRASNLVVRTHPRVKDALIIDSVLLNAAKFDQPFPDFLLAFFDLNGNLLAQRRFKPVDYLSGELAGASVMPTGQPVHISLEIQDPGEQAINYTASIPMD